MEEGVKLECRYCNEQVLGKVLYVHIVIQHDWIPTPSTVPELPRALYPLPAGMRRLQPHFAQIAARKRELEELCWGPMREHEKRDLDRMLEEAEQERQREEEAYRQLRKRRHLEQHWSWKCCACRCCCLCGKTRKRPSRDPRLRLPQFQRN